MRQRELKSFYYLDHFEELLADIEAQCPHLLAAPHRAFIERYRALARDERALLVRLIQRKARFFRASALCYGDLQSPEASRQELQSKGFLRAPVAGELGEVLSACTKPELLGLLERLGRLEHSRGGWRSRRKAELLDALLALDRPQEILRVLDGDAWVTPADAPLAAYLLFIYFGRQRQDGMAAFALRDLGLLRRATSQSGLAPAFASREAAEHGFFYARVRERIDTGRPRVWQQMAAEVATWPRHDGRDDDPLRAKAIHRLGRCLEKAGQPDLALQVFAQTDGFPAVERYCRLAYAAGQRDAVRRTLERIREDPVSDEALLFAEDFYARKFGGGRIGRLTRQLRAARELPLDDAFRGMPEYGVIAKLRERGEAAYWTENAFWRACFGCFFWEELFTASGAARASAFDQLPTCLQQNRFYADARERIEAKLAAYDAGAFARSVQSLVAQHAGEDDGFIAWSAPWMPILPAFIRSAPPGALPRLLRSMAEDFRAHASGFPDLLVLGAAGPRCIEVKAEGDQIRRRQLIQLQSLQKVGLPAEVLRVRWVPDPGQSYVVVDVETTGGRASQHRLTEIAAVKVQGGRIVDEFQSLLNPERPIPGFITRLTGITDAMVAEAPRFADLAAKLLGFLGDAVFVAHNAKFDYGFLRAECARAGLDYRRPVLCTVAESRRLFPGLKSYGLKALCAHFQIPLGHHHRALCDARATAQILLNINRRRQSVVPGPGPVAN